VDKSIVISLSGRAEQYRFAEDAYDRLARYLDRSASRLQDDPDRAEVLGDLERSVGDKLSALLGSEDRLVTTADIDGVLEEIGAVDTGHQPVADEDSTRPRRRRLQRIREGQEIAGVCTGLAAYAEVDVAWVRTVFIFATLLTAGIFVLVYIALVFILPVASKRESYDAEPR
jgi:phage shock protein PspC (stress-responsive transcriptional regulator)